MRGTGYPHVSVSGVPLVFDHLGYVEARARQRIGDPLSPARGLAMGIGVALLLWSLIAMLLGAV